MKASLKISQIESKISDLQSKKQYLLQESHKEIATLITALDLSSLDDKVLIGGLLFLKHKVTIQDLMVENWRNAGERFLRHTKRTKKINTSKKDTSSLPVHQPSQNPPQLREKKNETPKAI